MRTLHARSACLALATILSTGCATSYTPQSNGRIALVTDGLGGPQFVRDGVIYRAGPFGGDIEHAVAGNPRAEAEAAKYASGQTTGSILTLVGLAGVIAGVLMYSPNDAGLSNDRNTTAVGVALGGFVIELIGVIISVSSRSHLWDAINMYNDDVAARQDAADGCRPLPGVSPVSP